MTDGFFEFGCAPVDSEYFDFDGYGLVGFAGTEIGKDVEFGVAQDVGIVGDGPAVFDEGTFYGVVVEVAAGDGEIRLRRGDDRSA